MVSSKERRPTGMEMAEGIQGRQEKDLILKAEALLLQRTEMLAPCLCMYDGHMEDLRCDGNEVEERKM